MKNIGKTHFDFSEFTGAFSKEISISFLEWFVGFSEGDGSFAVSYTHLTLPTKRIV